MTAYARKTEPVIETVPCVGNFVDRSGVRSIGIQLFAYLHGIKNRENLRHRPYIERVLRKCVRAAQATLLEVLITEIPGENRIDAVALLSESHCIFHLWPDLAKVDVDFFTCGGAQPTRALKVLYRRFKPVRLMTHVVHRGTMLD